MSLRKLILTIAVCTIAVPAFAQSANDDCVNAIQIFDGDLIAYDTTLDLPSGVLPTCGGGTAPNDIWFVYEALADGILTLSLCNGNTTYDSRIAAYTGGCGAGVQVACNDDACGLQSELALPVITGTFYEIQVAGFNAATGTGELGVSFSLPATNDDCTTPTAAVLGLNAFDLTSASTDGLGVDPAGCSQWAGDAIIHNDVWFTYTVSGAHTPGDLVSISTCNLTTADTKVAVFDAATAVCPPAANTTLGCNDDGAGCANFTSIVEICADPGDELLIQIGGFAAATTGTGDFEIAESIPAPLQAPTVTCTLVGNDLTATWDPQTCGPAPVSFAVDFNGTPVAGSPFGPGSGSVTIDVTGLFGLNTITVVADDGLGGTASGACSENLGAPANDNCIDAIAVSLGTTAVANQGSTADEATSCGTFVNVWYSFTPAADGLYNIDTCGSNWDTELSVHEGVCGALVELGCSSLGVGGTPCTPQSGLTLSLLSGVTYLISVDGFAGSVGGLGVLNITESTDPVTLLVCDDTIPGEVTLSWVEPVPAADSYNVYVNGVLEANVSGGTALYTYVCGAGVIGNQTFAVEALVGAAVSPQENCQGSCGTPPNDLCTDAIAAIVGSNALDITASTTDGLGVDPGTCDQWAGDAIIHNDLWWTHTVGADGLVRISTCNIGGFDSKIAVWDGAVGCTPDPLLVSPLACQDDGAGCAGFTSEVSFPATTGDTLLIQIGGFAAATTGVGTWTLEEGLAVPLQPAENVVCDPSVPDSLTVTWTDPTNGRIPDGYNVYFNGALVSTLGGGATSFTQDVTGFIGIAELCVEGTLSTTLETAAQVCCTESYGGPANDDCADAITVGLGVTPFDTNLATDDGPAMTCAAGGSEIWFLYTGTGDATTFSLCGSAFDTAIEIFTDTGACPVDPANLVICNDDSCGLQSEVTINTVNGQDYRIRVGGFAGGTGTGTLDISFDCGSIDPVTCDYDCATDTLTISWLDNGNATLGYDILENGVIVGSAPQGSSSFTINGPPVGTNTYDITWLCALGGQGGAGNCTVDVTPPLALTPGTTDVIFHSEGLDDAGNLGLVDSGAALELALNNNGQTTTRLAIQDWDVLITSGCLDLSGVQTVWVMTGTFPNDTRITVGEGDALAALAASGTGIYFEGGDHWGFLHTNSNLDARDGIEEDTGANIADGGDTLLALDGADAVAANLLLAGNIGVAYTQDQGGNDFTDELSLTGTTAGAVGDPDVATAETIWTNPANATIVGVAAVHNDGGVMLSSSWEFGGYGGDQDALAGEYLAALGRTGPVGQGFVRTDCNADGNTNIADAIFALGILFPGPGGPNVPACELACDANDDNGLNIADAIFTLGVLFPGPGGPPTVSAPFPGCGADPTPGGALTCAAFTPCP